MKKKIYIINGSPRKNRNTDKMCKSFADGVKAAGGEAEIIRLYDIDFKGCYSCFACKLLNGANYGRCAYPDGLKNILEKVSMADGVVFASPVYFGDVSGVMKMFIERLVFPFIRYDENFTAIPPKKLKTAVIYTMNVDEKIFNEDYIGKTCPRALQIFENWIEKIYEKPERICAFNTYQFPDYNKYFSKIWDEKDKKRQLDEVFPNDLKKAYLAGKKMVLG